MNTNIFIALLITFVVVGLTLGCKLFYDYKKPNENIGELLEGLDNAKMLIVFIGSILKQLEVKNKDDINKIVDIIVGSLEYVQNVNNVDSNKEKIEMAYEQSLRLCQEANIPLDEEGQDIIKTAIVLTFNLINKINNKKIEE